MKKTVISLFSGAMGLDLGLERAGFRTVVAIEKDRTAIKTIQANRSDIHVFNEPIEDVTSAQILETIGVNAGQPMLVSGGPCCQSFSTVGSRGSLSDPRGGLFREFTRIVKDCKPRFFVMENVKGILSAAIRHRPLNERGPGNPPLSPEEELGSALKVILSELAELKYYVRYGLVNSADYGVPQSRLRVIFLGSRDGEDLQWLTPTHAKEPSKKLEEWISLKKGLGDLREQEPEFVDFPAERRQLLALLSEGQNWTNLPESLYRKALGAAFDSWGGRGGFCRRLAWGKPAPTLTTSPNGRATTLCHPTELRPLSVREYARLQQFPDDWQFVGSTQQKYAQIGNAVPVGLGEAIGLALNKTIRRTGQLGVSQESASRKGTVVCVDDAMEQRLTSRKRKTQLHPTRLLKSADREKIREWLLSSSTP